MARNRQFAMELFLSMGTKLREMEKRLESLNFKPSRDRILDFIKESILSKCKTLQDGTLVCPFLTHVDIAKMTDTSRQTVTLVLNELKRSDLIDFDRNVLEIHDVAALCG
jgi:CRP-like cAMP-binding protein